MSKKYYLLVVIWVLVVVTALVTYSFLPAYVKETGDLYQPYEYSQMYLENDRYSEVVIEYDYMRGQEPDETAVMKLEEKVEEYTDKESVESVIDDQISIEEKSASYDSNDISRLKEEYQDHERGGNKIPIHVLYLDGVWEENKDVLGLSQRPEQIVIFNSVISDIEDNSALEPGDVEGPVLIHEFGHLLSLVGLNYESDHEDHEYPNHCDKSAGECVMAGSVEIREDMDEAPPDEFCELCEEDLEYIRDLEDPFGFEDLITYISIGGQYTIGIWGSAVLVDSADDQKRRKVRYVQDSGYKQPYQKKQKVYSSKDNKRY